MNITPPPLVADPTAGLWRLKLAAMRRLAPELLVTARTQRWNLEEFLRTLIEGQEKAHRCGCDGPAAGRAGHRRVRPGPRRGERCCGTCGGLPSIKLAWADGYAGKLVT